MTEQRRLNDAEMLDVLERHAQGQSAAQVGRAYGLTRNAVLGLLLRSRAPDVCVKPENRDGGMPADWWKAGLAKRHGVFG